MMQKSVGRLAAALAAVSCWLLAVPTFPDPLPNAPGTWKPWKGFTAIASTRKDQAAAPALVKAFEAELLALNEILKRAPGVATPVGFSVETWGHLASYRVAEDTKGQPGPGGLPLIGALSFGAFPIFEYERNGKIVREDTGETALLQFSVNEIVTAGTVTDWAGLDYDAGLQPLPKGEIAGLPRYGDTLIVARDPAALWTPLPLRDALDLLLLVRQKRVQDFEAAAGRFEARLADVRSPAYLARRLKSASGGADPEGVRREVEASIKTEEASILKELSPSGGTGQGLAESRRAVDEVNAWIASLTPAEAAAASCYAEKPKDVKARFKTVPAAGCHPLVRPNYAYFDKAKPRSVPQVLAIGPIDRCFDTANKYNRDANDPSPAGCRANRALVESVDKTALRAWVR